MKTATACAILGVDVEASQEELRKAWRALALQSHPDKNPNDADAAARFREVAEAYKVLSHSEIAYKSYDALASEMDDVRSALTRATELAAQMAVGASGVGSVLRMGGATWIGEVDKGRPQGVGDLILPNGSVHHGTFDAGRASGTGVLYEASGSVMRGSWVENRRTGSFETTDPKGGIWHDTYDEAGKRTSRKKGAPPPAGCPPAAKCRVCGVKFHEGANFKCLHHSGKWVEAPTHNADGSAATVDTVAFPDGGLWLCCGAKTKEPKDGERGCTVVAQHVAAAPPPPVPVDRRLEEVPTARDCGPTPVAGVVAEAADGALAKPKSPSFIESSFTTRVAYEEWRKSLALGGR